MSFSPTTTNILYLKIENGTVSLELAGAEVVHEPYVALDSKKVTRLRQLMQQARLDDETYSELLESGKLLFDHLLPGTVGQTFLSQWRKTEPVHLHLELPDIESQFVPWEYLAMPGGFLSTQERFTLSRHVTLSDETPPPAPKALALPLRILVAVASPLNLEPEEQLDPDREVQLIRRGLAEKIRSGQIQPDQVELEVEDVVSPEQLKRVLDEFEPHVLHLTGHGFFELNAKGQPYSGLLLEDARGQKLRVTAAEFGEYLQGRAYLRTVVLSACRTALPDLALQSEKAITSTAAELVRRGIPAVVAMQESVRDKTASRFAQFFYPALLKGKTPGEALASARNNLTGSDWTEGQGKASDWGMPVLLTSVPALHPFTFTLTAKTPRPPVNIQGTAITPLREDGYFVGRQSQQRELRRVLTGNKEKLAIISGLGGMGKSTLTQRVVERFGRYYQLVQFVSVKDWQGISEAMRVLAQGLNASGHIELQQNLEQSKIFSPAEYGTLAGKALDAAKAILVLDNFEDLLDWEQAEDESEPRPDRKLRPRDPEVVSWLDSLFTNLGKGRVLITTRYNFEFTDRNQNLICRVNLRELGQVEAVRLMGEYQQLARLNLTERTIEYGKGLNQPLLIGLAESVLEEGGKLEDLWDETATKYSLTVALEKLYDRLPLESQVLLRRCAVYRGPLPLEFWSKQLPPDQPPFVAVLPATSAIKPRPKAKTLDYLHSLIRCRLVDVLERSQGKDDPEPERLYSQPQSVRYFGKRQLEIEELAVGLKAAHLRAAQMYEYYADYTSKNLGDWIDAKSHFVDAEEMAQAVRLVQSLNPAMNRQGAWQIALALNLELSERLKKHEVGSEQVSPADRADLLMMVALYMADLGQPHAAIEQYQAALTLARNIGDKQIEGNILGNLGTAYLRLGDYPQAISYHNKRLEIAVAIGDKQGEGNAYANLGNVYQQMGQYSQAVSSGVRASLIFNQIQSPNVRQVWNILRDTRVKTSQSAFEQLVQTACQQLKIDYQQYLVLLEQGGVLGDEPTPGGLSEQLQAVGQVIGLALIGSTEEREIVQAQILPGMERAGSGFEKLAAVLRQLLAAQRQEWPQIITEAEGSLDETDQAILQLALQTAANPATDEEAEPGPNADANDAGLGLAEAMVIALRGNVQMLAQVKSYVEQMQDDKETRKLGARLEMLLDGERNLETLTRGLPSDDKTLIESILARL